MRDSLAAIDFGAMGSNILEPQRAVAKALGMGGGNRNASVAVSFDNGELATVHYASLAQPSDAFLITTPLAVEGADKNEDGDYRVSPEHMKDFLRVIAQAHSQGVSTHVNESSHEGVAGQPLRITR